MCGELSRIAVICFSLIKVKNATTSSSVHTNLPLSDMFVVLCPQTPEAVGGKVRYVRLDVNAAVSIPFNQPKPGASEPIFICANQRTLIMAFPS